MKVSLNTAQYYSNVDLMPEAGVDELVKIIGAQIGAVETVEGWGARYEKIVVAKVVTCEKHPNADKLHVCHVDDGGVTQDVERKDGLVEVVCGAPNVEAGQTIAWIPPGAIVPSTYDTSDPFVLQSKELRGAVSNGMIASAAELGISDDHSGILVIKSEDVGEDLTKPGTPFAKLYGLDDVLIDIENKMFTHRPDCFGVLGVAREIAGVQGKGFESPDWYLDSPTFGSATGLVLHVKNDITDLVPRFMAVAMSGVEIKPSPIWLQALLTRVGMKPINNVVDITNYLGYITAQPLHAYDYDKVKALSGGEPTLAVRYPKSGETVALLNGKTIEPRSEAIMIATDKELVGVGGIMGGTSTEVDETTKNIIIECANFDMYSIRRTSMHHGLFTDAATRFTKGQSLLQNDRVIAEAMRLASELAGAKQASDVIDSNVELPKKGQIEVSDVFISSRLGLQLDAKTIEKTLTNAEFNVELNENACFITAPFWRTDIEIKEDIVEEVGRLVGFDTLPLELPKRTLTPSQLDPKLSIKKDVRSKLARYGANEVLTYSFVHGDLLQRAGQDPQQAFRLGNALSPDLQYYRLSLTPSLLNHVHQNIKAGYESFALFEIGKSHNKQLLDDEKVPLEFDRVALVIASKSQKSQAYFTARKYVSELLGKTFEIVPFDEKLYDNHSHIGQMTAPFEPDRSALIIAPKGYVVGIVGEYMLSVAQGFKLPDYCAGFELFLSAFGQTGAGAYIPLSRFPGTNGDITLEIPYDLPYGSVAREFKDALERDQAIDRYVTWSLKDIYCSEKTVGKKRYTFHVVLTSYSQTLKDQTLEQEFSRLSQELSQSLNAQRI